MKKIIIFLALMLFIVTSVLAYHPDIVRFDRDRVTICPPCRWYLDCSPGGMDSMQNVSINCTKNYEYNGFKPEKSEDINISSIILFRRQNSNCKGLVNKFTIHRVVNITYDRYGREMFVTKGDNNNRTDKCPVALGQIISAGIRVQG